MEDDLEEPSIRPLIPVRAFLPPGQAPLQDDLTDRLDLIYTWCKTHVIPIYRTGHDLEECKQIPAIEEAILQGCSAADIRGEIVVAYGLRITAQALQREHGASSLLTHSLLALGLQHWALAFVATSPYYRRKLFFKIETLQCGIGAWRSCSMAAITIARSAFAFLACGMAVWFPDCVDDVLYKVDLLCGPVGYPPLVLAMQIKSSQQVRPDFNILFRDPDSSKLSTLEWHEQQTVFERVCDYNEYYKLEALPGLLNTGFWHIPIYEIEECLSLQGLVFNKLRQQIPLNWEAICPRRNTVLTKPLF